MTNKYSLMQVAALSMVLMLSAAGTAASQESPPPTPADRESALTQPERAAVAVARAALAREIKEEADTFAVVSVEPRTWPDSGLGCAPPGAMTLQVITEGFAVVLASSRGNQRVHVAGSRAVICDKPELARKPRVALPARNLEVVTGKARTDLAARLGVPPDEVRVSGFAPVRWPDSTMDCAVPGEAISARPTRGYRLQLRHAGRTYIYHTDLDRVRACPPIESK